MEITDIDMFRSAPAAIRELIGVNRSTWGRWIRGQSRAPAAAVVLVRMLVGGELPQGGADWEGWRFYRGRLYDPSGQWHSPETIIVWEWTRQQLQAARAAENTAEAAGVIVFPGPRSARAITAQLRRRLAGRT